MPVTSKYDSLNINKPSNKFVFNKNYYIFEQQKDIIMKELEKFSIDTVASGKKEMKKVREYLRGKRFSISKRKDGIVNMGSVYLSNYHSHLSTPPSLDFIYYPASSINEQILTLPRDWDKLVKLVEGAVEEKPKEVKFKVGDWVVLTSSYFGASFNSGDVVRLINYTGIKSDGVGEFSADGMIRNGWLYNKSYRHATPAEVKSHLEATLKEKGVNRFVDFDVVRPTKKGDKWGDDRIEPVSSSITKGSLGSEFYYNEKTDTLFNYGVGLYVVYEKGVFATLKETLPEINGYNLEETDGGWKFGCVEFNTEILNQLRSVMSQVGIDKIELSNGNIVTKAQIGEVYDYVQSNR